MCAAQAQDPGPCPCSRSIVDEGFYNMSGGAPSDELQPTRRSTEAARGGELPVPGKPEAPLPEAAAVASGPKVPRPGGSIGDYLILEQLDAGGCHLVYMAHDRKRRRVVAVKVLVSPFARRETAARRLWREVEAAGRLNHPNIVPALEAGEDRGVPYIVMEYIEGNNLDRIVRDRGRLTLRQGLDVVIQAARGLEAAHAREIVHREVQPSHLMLDAAGTVRVIGLGRAWLAEDRHPSGLPDRLRLTDSALDREMVDYMAPERAEDPRRADHRADIYSLGCTLYFLLTGRGPFVGETTLERLMAHLEQPAPRLKVLRSDAPNALEDVYLKMLAKRPEDRPQSMTEVISLLEACRTAAIAVPTPQEALSKSPRRRTVSAKEGRETEKGPGRARPAPSTATQTKRAPPLDLILAMATAVVFFSFMAWMFWPRRPPRREPIPTHDTEVSPSRTPVPGPRTVAQTIFDGKSGQGWMLTNKTPVPRANVQAGGLNPHGTGSYLVVYRKKLGDFILDFDYKLSKGCHSGVFLRVGDLNDPVHTAIEVALADTTGCTEADSGAFYGLVAPSRNTQKPAGEWNHMTITAQGPVIAVSLNGVEVSRINVDEWTVPGRRPDGGVHRAKDVAIARLPRSGYIGFQDLRGDCWFRAITLETAREVEGPTEGRVAGAHGESAFPANRATTPSIRAASRGEAWRPASRTSWCVIGVPSTPAAVLDTKAMPSTSIPACRATMASGTVDIPTTSAPRVRSIRISAGVS
jgi:serine/threonine protein kinase